MGIGKLNVWVSDAADPCGTWNGDGNITILDCKGILEWSCGRFRDSSGEWHPVPNGQYANLPFRCGHLEVELPPGCYWAIAGYVSPSPSFIHLNYTTHVGIAEVGCDETACVKLFNPSIRLCWNWFLVGLRMLAARGGVGPINPETVAALQEQAESALRDAPRMPIDRVIEKLFDNLVESAKTHGRQG